MKIAFYMEDGLEQIVLTPQTDTERAIVRKLHDGTRDLSIKRGNFYPCNGGWIRHGMVHISEYGRMDDDESTIIVMTTQKPGDKQCG